MRRPAQHRQRLNVCVVRARGYGGARSPRNVLESLATGAVSTCSYRPKAGAFCIANATRLIRRLPGAVDPGRPAACPTRGPVHDEFNRDHSVLLSGVWRAPPHAPTLGGGSLVVRRRPRLPHGPFLDRRILGGRLAARSRRTTARTSSSVLIVPLDVSLRAAVIAGWRTDSARERAGKAGPRSPSVLTSTTCGCLHPPLT